MKIPLTIIGLTGGLLISGYAAADIGEKRQRFYQDKLTGSIALGFLAGESQESIYHPNNGGKKASELDWKINSAVILKGDVSYDILPRFSAGLRGWTTLSSGNGTMDDYDWLDNSKPGWSHWSHHAKTDLNYANEIDVNIIGWLVKAHDYKVGATFGYQRTAFSWSAYGGAFNYDNGNDIFTFPNSYKIIGYRQTYSMPYIGLIGSWRYQDFELSGLIKFSDWVEGKSNDEHYDRDLTIRNKGNNARHLSATVSAGYYIHPQTKIYAEAAYSRYEEARSGLEWKEAGSSNYFDGDWSGLDNKYYTLSLGVQYKF
ncbi:protease [Brenneria roseae subsp. roseae]|uniref:omptin family outer membrane protease n=1 Tax=Brenneria roseae TaxID=1509241 RepID=UPI000D60DB1F|nr:omptin family outer membrane protease [Brenneria roseae]PWC19104.1 protease [Brenneria roseae subsp. roseae]